MMDRVISNGEGPTAQAAEADMRVHPVGADALLLEVDDPPAWFAELNRRREAGELAVVDIVPGARTVLLDGLADPAGTAEAVRGWRPPPSTDEDGPLVEIPVTFDGPDLDEVATLWGTDPARVADRLTRTGFRVAFCGFAPGFAYLTGLPASLAVPRRATPRTRVEPGSVGLADTYAGIYPTPSPGGWRLVGRTDVTLFDPGRTPPALLTPGTRVRFVARPASESTIDTAGEEAPCSPS
jgi:KipI family sensor histidine kinase inhibitor